MTQEEKKQLLLIDLCARLPYEVQCEIGGLRYGPYTFTGNDVEDLIAGGTFKPYLRPMSSMTEEEKEEMKEVIEIELTALEGPEGFSVATAASSAFEIDFYNKHHFDYRGLIKMGLALEAPVGMYKQ